MSDEWADGQAILNWSWAGTALFTVTAVTATAAPAWFEGLAVLVALALFAGGLVVMVWAFLIAVQRSRTDAITIGGLFFAVGSAPPQVQRILLASLVAEIVVALVTASIGVFTSLAFGILVPVWALGLTGLWCARYGTFESRRV